MASEDLPPLVLVTGASGYIGSWVVLAALSAGYRVRATVRSLSNEAKLKHLRNLYPDGKYPLEIVEGDLEKPELWPAAVEGSDYIIHVASPVIIKEPKDRQLIIRPAVEGVKNVLQAAADAKHKVKRVVLTSSFAAVYGGHGGAVTSFDEDIWTVIDNRKDPISGYAESKSKAEKAAWEFVESLPADKRFELAVVNPTFVTGPLLSNVPTASAEIAEMMLAAKLPGAPDVLMPTVSVRDVAAAHLLALQKPEAAGKRFILSAGEINMRDISVVLANEFKQHGYKVPTWHVPTLLLWVAGCFDKSAAAAAREAGRKYTVQSKTTKSVLGLELDSDIPRLYTEMGYSVIAYGIIPDKSGGKLSGDSPEAQKIRSVTFDPSHYGIELQA